MNTQGRAGEEQAARFLTARGWRILEKNYAAPCGEIDLIALDGKTLVFVEVKARAYSAFGGPLAGGPPAQQRRIAQTAALYVAGKRLKFDSIRFDVVCILPDKTELISHAFTPPRTTL